MTSIVGGSLIGIPLGDYVAGRSSPNWTLAYIGGALTIVSIPIYTKSLKNAKKAISIYNSELTSLTRNKFKPKLNFNINAQGALLVLRF